jgi:glyoxylase-like metal-dependent hydrolase (beta-lactamase superfamily II)
VPELIPGVAFALSPLVRRILAGDAGTVPEPGTNTYLVGIDEVAVIDPGPDDERHHDAIVGCGGDRIRWILVTHAHTGGDAGGGRPGAHAAGAARLGQRTGAELLAAADFDDGDQVVGTEFRLTVLHTPGHAPDHVCFLLEEERLLFAGDHVSPGGTVAPGPDGDWGTWREQLERVRSLRLRHIAPGHGDVLDAPAAAIDACLHRAAQGPNDPR